MSRYSVSVTPETHAKLKAHADRTGNAITWVLDDALHADPAFAAHVRPVKPTKPGGKPRARRKS